MRAFSFSSVPVFFQYRDGRLEGTLQIPRALLQDADYFAASLSGRCHCQEGDGGSRVSCVVAGRHDLGRASLLGRRGIVAATRVKSDVKTNF